MRQVNERESKEEKDKWWWGDCNDPSPFLVANARKLIKVKMFDLDQFKFPWNRWAPLKINAFVWRASLNRIPTRDAATRYDTGE
ncbi:hypothetical protein R6Q59_020456 [Mikania micrantha]